MKKTCQSHLSGFKLVSAAALLLLASSAHAAVIDLGAAQGFSGFFFGNVNAASDVEGRLAVGGDLTSGFDIGYRNPYGSSAPSLIVKGGVSLTNAGGSKTGSIYNGPTTNIDTNASIGPSNAEWVPGKLKTGDIVYGTSLIASDWQYRAATQNANYLNFDAAKTQLGALSTNLSARTANGKWEDLGGSQGLKLTGDGSTNPQVFNLGNASLKSGLQLQNIKAGTQVIINSSLTVVDFGGFVGYGALGKTQFDPANDQQASFRDSIIYNFSSATSLNVGTFVNGSVLAIKADVIGSGHLEGTLIANSLSAGPNGTLELGYEPFKGITTQVPEPMSYALMLAGLGVLGFVARRRIAA
ncbi:choice-of-anchor A family protein [Paucibacter sp. AS339]|uniref:choice-of-anchor A family protein n=1 Tax=Paucibacter hankyongi TaxID=3133434 RepID=UPI0030977C8D